MKKITSINNEYIKEIKKINENSDFFLLEGINLITEALKYNIIKDIFVIEKYLNKFNNFKNVILVNKNVLDKISSLKNPNEPIAICYKKKWFESKNKKILFLDRIQDPGNLGSIIRSAVSFNFDKIIISKNSVSLYNPKVLRATQGSFLFADIVINANLETEIKQAYLNKYTIISTFLQKEHNFKKEKIIDKNKIAVILGSEGTGISEIYLNYSNLNFNINTNKVESLNLAAAASIIVYVLSLIIINLILYFVF